MSSANEKKQRLFDLLRELFQLNQPDLDFGLYRIMHAKREQVETFLNTEFDQLIDQVFADRDARKAEDAKREYEEARQQAIEFGAPDPDAAPKVREAKERYDTARATGGDDAEIYDHLYRFFSRYYDEGDFLSLRRYGKGAAGHAEAYAIPYDGSEVVLHWANKDQYYIKTTENFSHYSFDPRKALERDETGRTQQLFDDAGGPPLKVHFRVVDAAEGAHNNVKENGKEERFFLLDAEPLAWEGDELVIRFNYRPDPDKTGQKSKWQERRNEQAVQTVLEKLAGEPHSLAGEYRAVLSREVTKGKDKTQKLLQRYVTQYTARNTMDYFIHKNLGGFLKRELDFYLKNEVLKLDDFVGSEDGDIKSGVREAQLKAMQSALEKAQAIRILAQRLIDFLAQVENFQKKLWLKKKLVTETSWCISIATILTIEDMALRESLLADIVANDAQREEWVELCKIDRLAADLTTVPYSVPLSTAFLRSYPTLIVDTRHFEEGFVQRLLAALEDLGDAVDGVIIHSDNFQALSLMQRRYARQVKTIAIDPPYNRQGDGFPYKDNYRHSSWASMMLNRLSRAWPLLDREGALFSNIDENERDTLQAVLDYVFGRENRIEELIWAQNTTHSQSPLYSTNHEYIEVYVQDRAAAERAPAMFREPKPGLKELLALVDELNPKYPTIAEIEAEIKRLYERHLEAYKAELQEMDLEYDEETKKLDPWRGLYNYCHAEYRDADGQLVPEGDAKRSQARIWVWQEADASGPAQKQSDTTRDPEDPNYRFYRPPHPVTGKLCPHPKRGWAWPYRWHDTSRDSFVSFERAGRIAWGEDETKVPRYKRFVHEVETNVAKSFFHDYTDGEKQIAALFGVAGLFPTPKPTTLPARFISQTAGSDSLILDFFAGSGTTGHAVINLNREDGGRRRFVLVEMSDYFDTILLPRLKKVAFTPEWGDGVPKRMASPEEGERSPRVFKVLRLESYEDALNNLALCKDAPKVDDALARDYLLRYWLDVETQGSQSLLNIDEFRDPTAYKLEVKKPGSDERVLKDVDLIETFNWLIGLRVEKLHAGRSFQASFIRKPDPLLPKDANTRLIAEKLEEAPDGPWWFRPVEGSVYTVPGDELHRQSVLVLWRTLTDDPEQDSAVLEAFLRTKLHFHPTRREDKALYHLIYINGTHNLPSLGKYGEVRLLEEEFHRRMWAQEEA